MNGRICDNCATVLALDASNGREASTGEDAAWITINAGSMQFDACTRACATALLTDGGPIQSIADSWLTVVAEIARTVHGDESEEGQL